MFVLDDVQSMTQAQRGWPWITPLEDNALMGRTVTVRRSGNLIDLSPDGLNELPRDLKDVIEPHLTYTYQRYLRGADRTDPISGYKRGPFAYEECRLYRYDPRGRLVCGIGFLPKITSILEKSGAVVKLVNCDPPNPRTDRYKEDWNLVIETFSFRPKQDECLIQIAGNEFGIIKAPTGFGKGTIIAMVCLLYPKAKIHVVTPSKDLVSKTVASLTKYIPNVGQVGCGKKRLGRVTVFSADSLHLSDGEADILLADEIHKLAAVSYSEPLAKYRNSRNFGFSATPKGRLDGADAKLESLFGPIIFDLSYQEAVEHGLVVPIKVEWLDVFMQHNPCEGKKDTAKKRWGIWRNDTRNRLIANKALTYGPDDQVLILVETIEHLLFLRKYLPKFEACYSENSLKAEDVNTYRRWELMEETEQPLSAKDREQLRKKFEKGEVKKAIATSVWATGVDFEQLAVLIRAEGMGSEIMDVQAPGRVTRRNTKGAKDVGIVVDCADQFDEGFHRKALGRRKTYKKNEWQQTESTRRLLG